MEYLDLSTLVIIVIAVFILLRLRSVLGQRTGYQKPSDVFNKQRSREKPASDQIKDNVVKLPKRGHQKEAPPENQALKEVDALAKPRTKLNRGLRGVIAADPDFSPKEFLSGADMAYEMIVEAYANAEEFALRNLLARDVFEGFQSAIHERKDRGETLTLKFIGIDHSEIKAAEMRDHEAQISVRFESQIISATLDKDGKVVDGDKSEVARKKDIWTFARDTRVGDPNWKVIATEAEG